MNYNHELEFKTIISKHHYDQLLFNHRLLDNIFLQTNHYFDTADLYFSSNSYYC